MLKMVLKKVTRLHTG